MAKKNSSKGSVQQVPIGDQDERKKALEAAMAQIEKQFGKGSVMRMGDQEVVDIDALSDLYKKREDYILYSIESSRDFYEMPVLGKISLIKQLEIKII